MSGSAPARPTFSRSRSDEGIGARLIQVEGQTGLPVQTRTTADTASSLKGKPGETIINNSVSLLPQAWHVDAYMYTHGIILEYVSPQICRNPVNPLASCA